MKLEANMIVETRNKRRGIILKEKIYWKNGGYTNILNYNRNLKPLSSFFSEENDIMKIYNFKEIYDIKNVFLDQYLELIWQRKEFDITNPNEIETLKALLKLDLNFIAKDKNGEMYAYQAEPRFDEKQERWFNTATDFYNYSNMIKIEKDFKWIENKGIINIKEILDENL